MISVQLDGDESLLSFLDASTIEQVALEQSVIDAHVIVYSVLDEPSFQLAQDKLKEVKAQRNAMTPDPVIILVANKQDVVRGRQISEHGNCLFVHPHH